jgi:hypothetical protein
VGTAEILVSSHFGNENRGNDHPFDPPCVFVHENSPFPTGTAGMETSKSAEERRAVRQDRSRPLVEAFEPRLREKLALRRPSSPRRSAMSCPARTGVGSSSEDGRIDIDVVERVIRPLTLNRKNALFAGSDGGAKHWAVIASLIETCKLTGVEPHGYLADVIPGSSTREAGSTSSCPGPTPPPSNSAPRPDHTGRSGSLGGPSSRWTTSYPWLDSILRMIWRPCGPTIGMSVRSRNIWRNGTATPVVEIDDDTVCLVWIPTDSKADTSTAPPEAGGRPAVRRELVL